MMIIIIINTLLPSTTCGHHQPMKKMPAYLDYPTFIGLGLFFFFLPESVLSNVVDWWWGRESGVCLCYVVFNLSVFYYLFCALFCFC